MAEKQVSDAYAAEVVRRLEEFVDWSRDNWPVPAFALMDSDFDGVRREIQLILGERLTQAQEAAGTAEPAAGGPQYRPVNPAPWP